MGLKSWCGVTQKLFVGFVSNSNLDTETKSLLYRVNARQVWFNKNVVVYGVKVGENGEETVDKDTLVPVPGHVLKLARRIVKHIKNRCNTLPDLSKSTTMMLDGPVAEFHDTKNDVSTSFDYWVRVSTLVKGKPVWVPLKTYGYVEDAPGSWANFTQVTVGEDKVTIRQVKQDDPVSLLDGDTTVGLDFGLTTLFATDLGDLLGRSLYPWLVRVDEQVEVLSKALQRQGLKLKGSKRYRNFQKRIKEHVKNEVNRVLNRVVDLYDPSRIVVEKLDFRGKGLSKRLRRILTRSGRAAVEAKLKSLKETRGVDIVYVPSYYSSQECAPCGYVDKRNRNGKRFRCRFCGNVSDADVNASRVTVSRCSWLECATAHTNSLKFFGRAQSLKHIDDLFRKRWGVDPVQLRKPTSPFVSTDKGNAHAGGLGMLNGNPEGFHIAANQTL